VLSRPFWFSLSGAAALALGVALLAGCQGHDCSEDLLCAATQEEADRLNATAECPNYGYCPWLGQHGDAGGDANGADAGDDVIYDDADAGE
jgi:hypothetical protein